MNNLEVVNTRFTTVVKADGYSCKVERGDIRHGGVTYKDQARRLTLTTPDGSELRHETMGSNCDIAARKWLSDSTKGAITDY
jgi:hypothetical protein